MIPFVGCGPNYFGNFVEHASRPKERGRATHIFYLGNYYKKTNGYFSIIRFASSRLLHRVKHGQSPKGVWQDHAHISLKSYCRVTVEYFCIVILNRVGNDPN